MKTIEIFATTINNNIDAFLEFDAKQGDSYELIMNSPIWMEYTTLHMQDFKLIVFGSSMEDRLNACFQYMMEDVSARDRFDHAEIQDGGYKYDGATFTWFGHYCFAKGRISFDDMISGLRDSKKSA